MRIRSIDVQPWNLKLKSPFTISLGTFHEARNVLVTVEVETPDGRTVTGHGEGAPAPVITGETQAGGLAFARQVAPLLVGRDPRDMETVHELLGRASTRHSSARAAIDLALHDAVARTLAVPLASLLGGATRPFLTDMTIGMGAPEAMAKQARDHVEAGFSILKLKLGSGEAEDVARVRAVRREVGEGVTLRVDANQGWGPLAALRIIERIAAFDIELVEQPVPAGNVRGLAEVTRRSPVPIMADESIFSPADAFRLASEGACHIFNIKLMKCGGLHPARKINAIAEAAHIRTFVGCMLESSVAIAGAAHFVAANPNVMGADLDAHLYLDPDPATGGPSVEGGRFTFPEGAGSGAVPRR